MHRASVSRGAVTTHPPPSTPYVWGIAVVAALGGLLFGYDWVVIGGARQFFEVYFHLRTASAVGWANSCALIGCFLGSLVAGALADRYGRKPVLLLSAVLFAVSSVLTGWAPNFTAFIAWRIAGGIAIGLSSNVSPLYIAEISPAAHRGRLVSLNQFAIVIGILLAQIANWLIAAPIPDHLSNDALLASWNVQFGWRWMFTGVAVPAIVFLIASLAIPESPRWLLIRNRRDEAMQVLRRVSGTAEKAASEAATIGTALRQEQTASRGWRGLVQPGVRRVLLVGIVLAVLQQWSGINILFNYAEEVYRAAGLGAGQILFDIVITGAINLIFTVAAMAFVDRLGRRPLMLLGLLRHRHLPPARRARLSHRLARHTGPDAHSLCDRLLCHDPRAAHLGPDRRDLSQPHALRGRLHRGRCAVAVVFRSHLLVSVHQSLAWQRGSFLHLWLHLRGGR